MDAATAAGAPAGAPPVAPAARGEHPLRVRRRAEPPPSARRSAAARTAPAPPRVLAVLVACDGERWLPRTLRALREQTRPVDAVVAVDAGSGDDSAALMGASLVGPAAAADGAADAAPGLPGVLLRVSRRAGVLDAARAALLLDDVRQLDDAPRATSPAAAPTTAPATPPARAPAPASAEWVWLLHDDSAPAPDALEHQLAAVEVAPGVGVAGAKLTDWHDPRRLQQVGLTTSRFGRRLTGVERGDLDQGQRDDRQDVLAVSTAGMLVRRDLLERLGGDPSVAHLGEELDLCRRVRLTGHRVVVVPAAVVHHADATRTGARATPAARRGTRWTSRRHEVHHRLVAAPLALLPLVVATTLVGAVLRALGRVSAKQPGRAPAELTAVLAAVAGLVRPGRLWTARRTWRRDRAVEPSALAPLRARPTEVWRWHRDRWQRRDWSWGEGGSPPVATAATEVVPRARPAPPASPGGRATAPLLLAALTGVALWGLRPLLGAGSVTGPALPQAPELPVLFRALRWEWSPAGLGSPLPGDPLLSVLAVLALPAGGSPSAAVAAVLVLALPLAGAGAWAAAGAATRSRPLRLLAALAWASAAPLLHGVDAGRLGAVLAHLALPWVALGLARAVTAPTRRGALTASAAAGLVAAVAAAGAPVLLPGLLVAVVVVALVARRHTTALAWSALSAVVLLGPLLTVAVTDPRALVADPGLAVAPPGAGPAPAWALLLGHPTAPGDGWWGPLAAQVVGERSGAWAGVAAASLAAAPLALPALLLALTAVGAAALTGERRPAVARAGGAARVGWCVAALGLVTAVVSSRTAVAAPSTTAWPGAGTSLLLLGAGTGALAVAELVRRAVFDREPVQAAPTPAAPTPAAPTGTATAGEGTGDGPGTPAPPAAPAAGTGLRVRRSSWRAAARAALCLVAVLPVATLAGWAAASPSQLVGGATSLPAVAADAGAGPDAVRTLDLDLTGLADGGSASATLGRGPLTLADTSAARTAARLSGPLLGPVTATAAEPGATTGTAVLQEVTALLAAGSGDPRPQLLQLGVGYVFVRGDGALDGVEGLARAGTTDAGVLYRLRTDGPGAVAAERPARARLVDAAGAPLAVLPSTGEAVTAQLPPAGPGEPGPRRVVLAERTDPGWQAALDGRPLERVVVDGWSVGFEVPAEGGLLEVDHDGGPVALWRWLQGLVGLLTLLLALPVPGTGRRHGAAR